MLSTNSKRPKGRDLRDKKKKKTLPNEEETVKPA